MAKQAKKEFIINVKPLKTKEEIAEFVKSLEYVGNYQNRNLGNRNVLLFKIGVTSALRVSDVLNLKIAEAKQLKFKIKEQKTQKHRDVNLIPIKDELEAYIATLPQEQIYLFQSSKRGTDGAERPMTKQSVHRIFSKAADFIGRNDIGTHTMRKTFGYHFYKNNPNKLAQLQMILNHGNVQNTLKYIGIEAEELDALIENMNLF